MFDFNQKRLLWAQGPLSICFSSGLKSNKSLRLQKVDLHLIKWKKCYNTLPIVTTNMICAGSSEAGKDTCQVMVWAWWERIAGSHSLLWRRCHLAAARCWWVAENTNNLSIVLKATSLRPPEVPAPSPVLREKGHFPVPLPPGSGW